MTQRTSQPARALALSSLIVGFIVVVLAIAAALGGNSTGVATQSHPGHLRHAAGKAHHRTPATYVVQSGDTLISIAHRVGVPVVTIERLNPEVDPQILVSGEKLKLR